MSDERAERGNEGVESADPIYREQVKEVAAALRRLHKGLVDYAREGYERVHGEVHGAGKLLQLLAHDPEFWWLRRMSVLMVEIDEMLDAEEFTSRDAASVRTEVENLIMSGGNQSSEFPQKYLDALQSDPHVVMEHANTRKVISVLPKSTEVKKEGEKGNGRAM